MGPKDLDSHIQRVLAGDLDSFGTIVRSYWVAVANFLGSTFPGGGAVDELAQEVFTRAFRSLPQYEATQPFWPWLRGIARHVIHEELRARRKAMRERRAYAELALLRQAEDSIPEPAGEPRPAEEGIDALRECLEEQTEEGSRLVRWFYVDRLSSDAIAHRLGCGASAVRNALMRLRRSLRGCVQGKLQVRPL